MPVTYRPETPTKARIALFTDNWLGASLSAVIGLVGLAGGTAGAARRAAPQVRRTCRGMNTRFDRGVLPALLLRRPHGRDLARRNARPRAADRRLSRITSGCRCGACWMPAAASACCARRCMRAFPRAQYTGLEYSEYLCERFGWTQRLAGGLDARTRSTSWSATTCCSTWTTAPRRAPSSNLGRLTRGVLYLSALTAA